jgi:membrane-bound lytic murein transglycosylase A
MFTRLLCIPLTLAFLLGGCVSTPITPVTPPPIVQPASPALLKPVDWVQLPGWTETDALAAWPAFLASCGPLKKQTAWQSVCAASTKLSPQDDASVRAFFEQWLSPQQVLTTEGKDTGLITGYYEPLLFGSHTATGRYRFPVYGTPDDLLIIDFASLYPELKKYRLRGRLTGNRVIPYYSREEIDAGKAPLQNKILLWVDDAVDLFFLQIQGSGRVQLENGELIRLGFADQNGYPYTSIGKKLVDQGELPLEQASMQGIKQWGLRNPEKLPALLDSNASYIFFRELPPSPNGPPGALGVPLTGGRSLAVDPRAIALGSPVYLSTTWPNSTQVLNRLMLAQDSGGAIKGAVRADFFWGFGEEAAKNAGSMRQSGRMWVLLPKEANPAPQVSP